MRTHQLSILALLPFLAGAAASAQFAPAKPAPAPQFGPTAPVHDSRTEIPEISAAKAALQQQIVKTIARNDARCYTVRSYQYTQDSAAPKLVGQTTCQVARASSALIVVQPK